MLRGAKSNQEAKEEDMAHLRELEEMKMLKKYRLYVKESDKKFTRLREHSKLYQMRSSAEAAYGTRQRASK